MKPVVKSMLETFRKLDSEDQKRILQVANSLVVDALSQGAAIERECLEAFGKLDAMQQVKITKLVGAYFAIDCSEYSPESQHSPEIQSV